MCAAKDTVSLISESQGAGGRRQSRWPSVPRILDITPNDQRRPSLARKESLNIPGKVESGTDQAGRDSPNQRGSIGSRRESNRSNESRVSAIDFSKLESNGQKKDDDDKGKTVTNTDSFIRTAIPYLPPSLAFLCLILNILIPGTGMYIICKFSLNVQQEEGKKYIS